MRPSHNVPAVSDKKQDEADPPDLYRALDKRLGEVHARQRLGIEQEYEARVFGHGRNYFHIENWRSGEKLIGGFLRMSGLYGIGRRNAANVLVRKNRVAAANIPEAFNGYTILQISDLHVEFSEAALQRATELLESLPFDICVLTGDFRALTHGPYSRALEGMSEFCSGITRPIYGVLGNHDTIKMVPALESMGIRLLLNEAVEIERGDQRVHLAGIDDAHYFRVDNIEKAASGVPVKEFSILLSHTPEVFRQAAHAGFDLMLSGHTHAGQICLPGGIPLKLNAAMPRRYGVGKWIHGAMQGYTSAGVGTSIVSARFNCPPEITLHRLERH